MGEGAKRSLAGRSSEGLAVRVALGAGREVERCRLDEDRRARRHDRTLDIRGTDMTVTESVLMGEEKEEDGVEESCHKKADMCTREKGSAKFRVPVPLRFLAPPFEPRVTFRTVHKVLFFCITQLPSLPSYAPPIRRYNAHMTANSTS